TAASTLAALAQRGDQMIIGTLAARLEDEDWPVRGAALEAVARLAPRGDSDAIALMMASLQDCLPYVRCLAADSLAELAPRGSSEAISALAERVRPGVVEHPMVHKHAAAALERLGAGTAESWLQRLRDGGGPDQEGAAAVKSSTATPSVEAVERWEAEAAAPGGEAAAELAGEEAAEEPRGAQAAAAAAPSPAPGAAAAVQLGAEGGAAWLPRGARCGVCA
ncbi:unnamed protein product, partial [Prorocentrum cordatum]